jgi:putative ABC transport system ATP-binding protein
MTDSPIVLRHLNHWFGKGEASKQALFDLSLSIAPGSLTVLMGPSGSGKTTVLTLMGCLREVMGGSVMLLGEELYGAGHQRLEALRREVGFIFQAHNLHESLTARQNVMMGLEVHGRGNAQARQQAIEHMLDLLGLGHRIDYLPASLSGGQKQRVAIARALVSGPKIVFADEPTAALDKESGMQVVNLLKALGRERGMTTVMVTHDNRIVDMADRILVLEEGRLVSDTKTVPKPAVI